MNLLPLHSIDGPLMRSDRFKHTTRSRPVKWAEPKLNRFSHRSIVRRVRAQ
jgi:hypothetical protein